MTHSSSPESKSMEVHDLTLRLEEAQETLIAIRSGKVDALVVKAGSDEQILLLRGANRASQVLLETLNVGALNIAPDATILYANQPFAELLGRPLEEVMGAPLCRFVAPDEVDLFKVALGEAAMGSSKRELTLVCAGGARVPVMVAMRAMGDAELSALTVVVTDLTQIKAAQGALEKAHAELFRSCAALREEIAERNRLEEALRQKAEALSEAGQRKDEFLAMLAHELRNPLAAILNAAGVLRWKESDPRAVAHYRSVIERQVRNLTQLVDDLLDVSRITRGEITLRKSVVDVAEIVLAAAESVGPLMASYGHALSVALPSCPARLEGDPARIEQVTMNLLGNAAKYTERGGRIDVAVERAAEEIALRVRDNGMGIPADLLPRVFELFVQGRRSLDRSQGGLGIGLTLVKRLVELHGGSVRAFSDGPSQGSEFVVRLPALKEDDAAEEAPRSDDRLEIAAPSRAAEAGLDDLARSGKRVMVVEDNIDAADGLRALLELWGHRVRMAFSGDEALRSMQGFQPEIVLIDIGLPGMDGYDVARHIRRSALAPARADAGETQMGAGCDEQAASALSPSRPLLVAVTGYGQEKDRCRAREAGFDCYLVKPPSPEALQQLLLLGLEAPCRC